MRVIAPKTERSAAKRLANDRRWAKASEAWLRQYPLCVLCLAYGKLNEGAIDNQVARQRSLVVDHITPHRGDAELFWDPDNWQTLCRFPCHDVDKQRHEQAGRDAAAWYELLRSITEQHGTHAMWQAARRQLPPHIARLYEGAG